MLFYASISLDRVDASHRNQRLSFFRAVLGRCQIARLARLQCKIPPTLHAHLAVLLVGTCEKMGQAVL
mgnify:CR=1 FL=1